MSRIESVLNSIQDDLTGMISLGLGPSTPDVPSRMAEQLRELGLAGPAREADRLAGLVGPGGDTVEQLNSFAKLHQMLRMVRQRMVKPMKLTGRELVPIPYLSPLHIEQDLLDEAKTRSLTDFPVSESAASRYSYLFMAAEKLSSGTLAPQGEGLGVWCNLRIAGLLMNSLAESPERALEMAGQALQMGNVVAKRNGLRVLERAFQDEIPLSRNHPALGMVAKARQDPRPLVRLEAHELERKQEGLPPIQENEPYPSHFIDRKPIFQAGAPFPGLNHWYGEPGAMRKLTKGSRGDIIRTLGLEAVGGEHADEREQALEELANLQDHMGIPYARKALDDRSGKVRSMAFLALGCMGDDSFLPMCAELLKTKTPESRGIVRGLGALGDIRGFSLLYQAFKSKVRFELATESLPLLGEAATPFLDRVVEAPELVKRTTTLSIIRGIYRQNTPDAVFHIVENLELLKDRRAILSHFKLQSPNRDLGNRILGYLIYQIRDPDHDLEDRKEKLKLAKYLAGDQANQVLDPILGQLTEEDRKALTGPKPRKKARKAQAGGGGQ